MIVAARMAFFSPWASWASITSALYPCSLSGVLLRRWGYQKFRQGRGEKMVGISARNKAFACWGYRGRQYSFLCLTTPKIPPEMGYVNEPSRIETEAQKTKNPLGYWPCGLLRTSLEVFMVPRAGLEPAREQSPSAYVLNSTGCNPVCCHLAPHVGCKSHTLSHTLHLHPPSARPGNPSPRKKPPISERPLRSVTRSADQATASVRRRRPRVHRTALAGRAGPGGRP